MSNNKIPGPEFGINEIVNVLTSEGIAEKADDFSKYNPLRPSSAGKCERELGHEFMEYRGFAKYDKEQNSPELSRIFSVGHHLERHVLDEMYYAFKKAKTPITIRYKQQTLSFFKLHEGTWIEGSIDGVIISDKWKIVFDVKSKNDKYSQFYKSSWDEFCEKLVGSGFVTKFGDDALFITDVDKFVDSQTDVWFNNNIVQLNFYACNPFLTERGINLASIIQLNKNDSRLREIRFEPSQALYEKTKAKFERVAQIVDTTKSVEGLNQDYVLGSGKCGFCAFRKQCWPEDDALKLYFKTFPPKQWAKDLDRLPEASQAELRHLFAQYETAAQTVESLDKIEEKIVSVLHKEKAYKIRLDNDRIYRTKRLKSGGPGGGERYVIRRDKE